MSFLFDRLRANLSLRQFQEGLLGHPIQVNQYGIPGDGSPSLPFSKEWEIQMAIFADFLRTAQTYGAGLIVATPSAHGARYLEQSLELHPIPGLIVVDLQEVSAEDEKQYHFAKDSHWNPRGHKKAARILFSQIMRRNILGISQEQPPMNDLQPQCLTS